MTLWQNGCFADEHNYARECAEILIKLKYEVTQSLRAALEKAWFVNRWGLDGRWIPADLYLEQLNFWVKCYYIKPWHDPKLLMHYFPSHAGSDV
ncbi:hypothetical protein PLICRDRAFT_177892 [Plicaturopsis crispa FD-325 SS-3]|nr:hypothetical protein PLICRDRAFT_177892 [Plicaturopsis crispa FD-325 SS-3]